MHSAVLYLAALACPTAISALAYRGHEQPNSTLYEHTLGVRASAIADHSYVGAGIVDTIQDVDYLIRNDRTGILVARGAELTLLNATITLPADGETDSSVPLKYLDALYAHGAAQVHYKEGSITLADGLRVHSIGIRASGSNTTIRVSDVQINGLNATTYGFGLLAEDHSAIHADNMKVELEQDRSVAFTAANGYVNVVNSTAEGNVIFYATLGGRLDARTVDGTNVAQYPIRVDFGGEVHIEDCALAGAEAVVRSPYVLFGDGSGCSKVDIVESQLELTGADKPAFSIGQCTAVTLIRSELVAEFSNLLADIDCAEPFSAESSLAFIGSSGTGEVRVHHGCRVFVELRDNATWSGGFASASEDGHRLKHAARVVLDETSTWNVTDTCWVESLTNDRRDFNNVVTANPDVIVYYNARNENNAALGAHTIMLAGGGQLQPFLPKA